MNRIVLLTVFVALVGAAGCGRPVKLQFASPPPDRVHVRGPLTLPAVQAVNADGAVVPDVKLELKTEPAGIIIDSPAGPGVANRGDVTLTWTTDKKLTLSHALRVLLPTRVELRCLPSCFGTTGAESKLETLVYSEADLIGDLKAPCSTDNAGVAKVDGEVLKFLGKGETMLTCKLEDAVVTKKIDVTEPTPVPPPTPVEGTAPSAPIDQPTP